MKEKEVNQVQMKKFSFPSLVQTDPVSQDEAVPVGLRNLHPSDQDAAGGGGKG